MAKMMHKALLGWKMEKLHTIESYSQNEWNGAILSLDRLADIRNFPDVAADVLMGRQEAFLGRGLKAKTKAIDPNIIGAICNVT